MSADQLEHYLKGVLDVELNIYIYKNIIDKLIRLHNSLGKSKKINKPTMGKTKYKLIDCMVGFGIFSGIVVSIISIIAAVKANPGFFMFIPNVIAGLFYGVGGLFLGGIVLGLISWAVLHYFEMKKLKEKLEEDKEKYDSELKRENRRLDLERKQQIATKKEIYDLQECLQRAEKCLEVVYGYNVLDSEYRNIYAVSSMYGYLVKGRTYSLRFNEQTGDQGAYNIYENECRLDRIIQNTEEIIYRLDQVAQYQYDLAVGLQNASNKIDLLYSSVNKNLKLISGAVQSIERTQSVIAYNSECAKQELALLAWMNTI